MTPGSRPFGPWMIALAWIPAVTVTAYWSAVVVKSIRMKKRRGKMPNVIPRERTGRYVRLLWAPTVVAWIAQLYLYALRLARTSPWLLTPLFIRGVVPAAIGALCCVIALGLTFVCWQQMGASWRIGIDPSEKTRLVVRGAYRRVRHPIYALSILLMLGCVLVVPTPLMLLTAGIHIGLLAWEACREEAYLLTAHGEAYLEYQRHTGRFLPRVRFL